MKCTLIVFLISLLSLATFAKDPEVAGGNLCFGLEHYGTNGAHDECKKAADAINSLNTDALRVTAKCTDVRNNKEERLNSGCHSSAFIVKSTVSTNLKQAEIEKNTVTHTCQEAGSTETDGWESSCLNGTSTFAVQAKNCAVQTAATLCLEKGFSNCSVEKATIKYKYYFFNEPRCVATAVIRN